MGKLSSIIENASFPKLRGSERVTMASHNVVENFLRVAIFSLSTERRWLAKMPNNAIAQAIKVSNKEVSIFIPNVK